MTQTAPAPLLSWFDIPYGTDALDVQRVDALLPAHASADHPVPVVIRIDGCPGWQRGTRWTAMAPFASPYLAQRGFTTVSASIRTSECATWPVPLEDALAVTDWIRENPLRLPIRPTDVGIWGHSAGGHLAAMTALTEGSGIRAVATIGGTSDFLDPAMAHLTENTSPVTDLVGGTVTTHRDVLIAASPTRHVHPDAPPFLIVHGAADETVPFSQAERLHDALQNAGVTATLHTVPGGHHNMLPDPDAPYYAPIWFDIAEEVTRFFCRHLIDDQAR